MSQQVIFLNCRNSESDRCPNNDLALMQETAKALHVPDFDGTTIQYMQNIKVDELNKICDSCDSYKAK